MPKYQLLSKELVRDWRRGKNDLDIFLGTFASPQGKVHYSLPHQKEFIQTMMTGNYDEGWMSGGNSSGKTWTGKFMATHWASYKFKPGKPYWRDYKVYKTTPYNVLCTGPEQKQAV